MLVLSGDVNVISRIVEISRIVARAYVDILIKFSWVVPSDDHISIPPVTNNCDGKMEQFPTCVAIEGQIM